MCLYVKEDIPSIAKEDIICYKIVEIKGEEIHPFYGHVNNPKFRYKLSEKAKSKLILEYNLIQKGLHSFSNESSVIYNYKFLKSMYGGTRKLRIMECIIPKEAEYYIGNQYYAKGYASNELIPLKIYDV